jgi:TadE-like protein
MIRRSSVKARKNSRLRQLVEDQQGLAIVELALVTPLVLILLSYGLEMGSFAMANHRVNQAAAALSDNMSRVGLQSALSQTQLRESDIIDGFIGMQRQAPTAALGTRGRVILSSLETNASGGQWIHWQRCLGVRTFTSSYGAQGDGATGTAFPGMGPATARVRAPPGASVMFVEIQYDYEPLFGNVFLSPRRIKTYNSFVTRSRRDLTQVYNPGADTVYSCDRFTSS